MVQGTAEKAVPCHWSAPVHKASPQAGHLCVELGLHKLMDGKIGHSSSLNISPQRSHF